ncbi:N/A [soil metagenome]
MSENTTPAAGEAPDAAKKKGGMKFIIIIALVLVIAGVGAGGFFYMRSSSAAATAETAKKTDKKSASKKDSEDTTDSEDTKTTKKPGDRLQNALPKDADVKKIIELPPFIVNLADTEQARYLRMTVSLGIDEVEASGEKPDQLFLTRVRNAMLAVLSDKKSEEILSVEGKTKLRKDLLQAAKAASESPEVVAIYITDFIVQL